MQPINIHLAVDDSVLQPSHLDITGINMAMGLNRVLLLQQERPLTWRGETILPLCTQRQMQWQAQVVLKGGGNIYHLNYPFSTHR